MLSYFRIKKTIEGKVKRFLTLQGLEVSRAPKQLDLSHMAKTPSAGRVIEFIGPSGVGKTTTFKHLETYARSRWLFPSSIALSNPVEQPATDFERAIKLVLFAKMDTLRRTNIGVWRYCDILGRLDVIVKQSLVISSNTHPKGFILDEGFCHFLVEQIMVQNEAVIRTLLQNRHFILLLSNSPETIAAQRKKRARNTHGPDKINQSSGEKLQNIAEQLEIYQQFGELAKRNGCEVLKLYVENDREQNIQKIIKFESRLNKV